MSDFDPKKYLEDKFDPKEYVKSSKKEAVKYEPEEDTMYSPEGVPLITPRTIEPAGKKSEAAREVLTDIAAAPVRAAMSVVKPLASASEALGTTALSKPVMQMDEGLKIASSPEEEGFLGSRGPISTVSSLGGDILGGGALLKGANYLLKGSKALPVVGEKIMEYAPKIEQAWDKMNLIPKTAISSAIGSQTQPVGVAAGEEGYGEEKGKQAATAAVLGPLLGKGAQLVGGVLSPQLQRLKDLEAQGIDIQKLIKGESTLGQILGGGAQKLENFLSVFPFSGLKEPMKKGAAELTELGQKRQDVIGNVAQKASNAIDDEVTMQLAKQKAELSNRNKAIDIANANRVKAENQALADEVSGYSIPVINKALEPIGVKLPPNVKGTEAIDFTQKAISKGYEDELNRIGKIPFTKVEKGQLMGFMDPKNLKNYSLKPDEKALLAQDVANLTTIAGKGRSITGRQWQEELQKLGDKSYDLRRSQSYSERQYGEALRDLKDQWMQLLENTSGSQNIKNLNKAHSLFQGPQRASTHLKTFLEGGDFTPEQLVAAMKQELPSKRFASGTDKTVEEAVKKYQEIAKRKADLKSLQEQRKLDLEAAKGMNAVKKERAAGQLRMEKRDTKQDIANAAKESKENVANLVRDVNIEWQPGYILNRLGVAATVSPIAKVLSGGAGALGLPGAAAVSSALTAPSIAALGLGPAARLLYTRNMQAMKKAATAPRPEEIKALGEMFKKRTGTAAGLGGMASSDVRTKHPLDYLEDTSDKAKDMYDEYKGD